MKRLFSILSFLLFINLFPHSSQAINLNDIYDILPNVASCNEGTLKDSEKQRILAIFNQIRVIHKLKPLEYSSSYDKEQAKSALITVANMLLDHFPKPAYSCYSQDGYNGSSTSNLYIFAATNSSMAPDSKIGLSSWIIDKNVSDIGHRRNMLNPFLKYTSFGRVDGNPVTNPQFFVTGMSLKVHNLPENQNLTDWNQDFVAYPFEDYPSDFFDTSWYLSFSVVADKSNIWNNGQNQIDFSPATVTITDQNGNSLAITDLKYDYLGYGIPNCLYWKANGINRNVRYNVQINNVKVLGNTKSYSYWFRIGDPLAPPSTLPPPILLLPANNSTVDPPVNLQWSSVSEADSYRLQVAITSDFQSPILDLSNLTTTSYTLSQIESETKYYWRVLALKGKTSSAWSQVFSFTTRKAPPATPSLLEPANNQTNVSLYPRYVWNRIPTADYYHIQVALDNEFVYVTIDNDLIIDTFYISTTELRPNRQYFWHIRSRTGTVWGNWSEPSIFWTLNPANVENDDLVLIKNYAIINSNSIFEIELPFESDKCEIVMFDNFGRKIPFANISTNERRISFIANKIPFGVYYLKIDAKGRTFLIKVFVIQ